MFTKITAKKLYGMKLGEFLSQDNSSGITHVPGGWIYSGIRGDTFVPYDNEFHPAKLTDEDVKFQPS